MDSDAIEVRAISRGAAVLIALIGGTLLATVRVAPTPAPGVGAQASLQVIRKKSPDDAALAAAQGLAAKVDGVAFAQVDDGAGLGQDIWLWMNGPGGEIVFRNADRYQRCVMARNRRLEVPDCPSAYDRRRMVLDTEGRNARGA